MCKAWFPLLAETDMVDPFSEHYPNKRIWSFIGSGKAGNSRIDRVYGNADNVGNMNNMRYIQTPFVGHRILTFNLKSPNEYGKGYYKMNTSILRDEKFKKIMENLVTKIDAMNIQDPIRKWTILISAVKDRSKTYSKVKNRVKNG